MKLGDGVDFFRKNVDPIVVSRLLESCTIWIDPKCYKLLPIFYPHAARKAQLYNADWSAIAKNKGQPKKEGNIAASKAQNAYLGITGLNREKRPNWACCHIWANDDPTFQSSHAEVNNRRYFTCAANVVLVPAPLKTFTDTVPEVIAALRYTAFKLYRFLPEDRSAPTIDEAGDFYPTSWKNIEKIRVSPITSKIETRLKKQVSKIRADIKNAGRYYPRDEVKEVITYWSDKVPNNLLADCLHDF